MAGRARGKRAAVFGGLDIVYFNIGISTLGGIKATPHAIWRRVFHITQAALPLLEADGGDALYVSSLAALRTGPYPYVAHEASKAALCHLSRSVAIEYAAAACAPTQGCPA
jgi:NAD(P)-dependent dehydrogenase (short-subunit alcohol dehydrogenase family)